MTITGGSALPKEDIERMVREAEEHAEEDKKRREAADVRNNAENLAYQTQKLLDDNADKLPEELKSEMQADVDAVKKALEGEDDDAVKKLSTRSPRSSRRSARRSTPSRTPAPPVPLTRPAPPMPAPVPTTMSSMPRSSTMMRTGRRSNDDRGQRSVVRGAALHLP